jgi:hypothetical protein
MDWGEVASFAKDVAPTLATALGGPAAGGAAKLLTSLFGGSKDDPEDMLNRLQQDPEARVKLEKIEKEHEQEMQRLILEGERSRMEHEIASTKITNQTMREEYKADIYWRRAVGWAFALTVVTYPVGMFYAVYADVDISSLAKLLGAMGPYWYTLLAVLGISAHHNGKRERAQEGEKAGGMFAGAINAIKGK